LASPALQILLVVRQLPLFPTAANLESKESKEMVENFDPVTIVNTNSVSAKPYPFATS